MSSDLAGLIAKRFIQRRDVKAVQMSNGIYVPDRELKRPAEHEPFGFKGRHLAAHLDGTATYGHYLLDSDSQARMFALDIDLRKEHWEEGKELHWCRLPTHFGDDVSNEEFDAHVQPVPCSPRDVWQNRREVEARAWFKYQMGMIGRRFAAIITKELQIDCAVSYSGHKGIHVYGFTGPMPAHEVRAAALLVLDLSDEWELEKGQHFFKHKIDDPFMGYPAFSVETFPKQDSLDGKDLGNLMRLPLGRNLKSPDPTFFLDLKTAPGDMRPHTDPVTLLMTGNPYT